MAGPDDRGTNLRPAEPQRVEAHEAGEFLGGVDAVAGGLTILVALCVYVFTLAPEVTLGDAGVFTTGAFYAGVPDCPGFPVWTLYAWVFTVVVPFSNISWRVGISSAFATAAACGIGAMLVSRCIGRIAETEQREWRRDELKEVWVRVGAGCTAGLGFGLDQAVWERAVKVDPWPLTWLLFALMIYWLLRWQHTPLKWRFLCGVFFIYGLLLTNQPFLLLAMPGLGWFMLIENCSLGRDFLALLTILLGALFIIFKYAFLPPIVEVVPYVLDFETRPDFYLGAGILAAVIAAGLAVKTRRMFEHWGVVMMCIGGLLAGLAFHFYLPVASMANPPMNWGYPRTVEGFEHLITRGQYERVNPTDIFHEPEQFFTQLWIYAGLAVQDFGLMYLVFALVPFAGLRRLQSRERRWLWGLAGIYVCVSVGMVILLNMSNDMVARDLEKVYFATSHFILAIFSGLGIGMIGIGRPSTFAGNSTPKNSCK